MREQVVDTAVAQVRGANGIAIASGGDSLREDLVEVCADRRDLLAIEDA
jgi:hypothetical protein